LRPRATWRYALMDTTRLSAGWECALARRRKSGPKRKAGPRTKSGKLSRAYKRNPEVRDQGTRELQAKRLALVNGGDPQMAASAATILYANGILDAEQRDAALRYGWAHALTYGRPTWHLSSVMLEPSWGPATSDMMIASRGSGSHRWTPGSTSISARRSPTSRYLISFRTGFTWPSFGSASWPKTTASARRCSPG
jgi:hypothetical protein